MRALEFIKGHSRMFGPDKLRPLTLGLGPLALGLSRSRRIKNCKIYVVKVLISNHSNYKGEFYKNLIIKGPVLILRDNTIIIYIDLRWHLLMKNTFQPPIWKKN